jgi:hypothetical protein
MTKQDLLDSYADKPVRRFMQIDGWCNVPTDDVMHPDDDGDQTCIGTTHELMRSSGQHMRVRLLIHEDGRPEDVRRLLTKVLDDIEETFAVMREDIPLAACSSARAFHRTRRSDAPIHRDGR